MKTLLSIVAGLILALDCFATGQLPNNTPLFGYLNYSTNGSAYTAVTNTFAATFTYPPAMSFYLFAGPTNAVPLTNVFVTTTNFAEQIATATNCTVYWVAQPVQMEYQYGSFTNVANSPTNFVFPKPYAYTPSVQVENGTTTNANSVQAVTSVSATGFTLLVAPSITNLWQSIGPVANPGPATLNY